MIIEKTAKTSLDQSLITQRTRLIPCNKSYRKFLDVSMSLSQDPRVTQYIGGVLLPEKIKANVDHADEHWLKHGYGLYLVQTKSGTHLGLAGLNQSSSTDYLIIYSSESHNIWYQRLNQIVQVSYRFFPECQGQGFATESLEAIIQHSFRVLNIKILCACIQIENYGSQRVATKCGFIRKGSFIYKGALWELHELKNPVF